MDASYNQRGATNRSLIQVLNNANIRNREFGESSGIVQSDFGQSEHQQFINTGLSQGMLSENQHFDWAYVTKELENEDDLDLLNYLKSMREPLTTFADQNSLTLLHHAVLNGTDGKTELIINYAKKERHFEREKFNQWINARTNGEGWTALHYASFQGNVDAIHTLIKHEAKIHELNNNGLNMLHVAA